jgi:acylphosphatase
MAIIRKRAEYSGNVQGVGFRYTTRRIANCYAVGGWVRNLANGNVELVAEGSPAEVSAFLAAVAERWAGHIARAMVADDEPSGLAGFAIR